MASGARTRYTKCGDIDVAYQVVGDGPLDLLLFTGCTIPIDCVDDEPSWARFQRRLASFGRVIRFDNRGIGLSDRGSPSNPPTHEQWVEDAMAVLDAVGSERAAVFAPFASAGDGIILAATQPERVSALILINGSARTMWAPDYPCGLPEEWVASFRSVVQEPDALELGADALSMLGPTVADDPVFRAWWDRAGNLGASPAMAKVIWNTIFDTDVRDRLPTIRVPTLVIQRTENALGVTGHGRYLAEHIPGATHVELPGADILYWLGDTGRMLDEIEEFLTGVRGGSGAERVLATVLFTDIVGSTEQAAWLGDGRWRDVLDRHDQIVRAQLGRFRGREVKTVGDGFIATFDSPGRAIQCAFAIREALGASDIAVRAGIHAGEIEIRGDDVAGIAVHIAARVAARADAGEVLVTSTVKELVVGWSAQFADRGEQELKGVPGTWRLFAAGI